MGELSVTKISLRHPRIIGIRVTTLDIVLPVLSLIRHLRLVIVGGGCCRGLGATVLVRVEALGKDGLG